MNQNKRLYKDENHKKVSGVLAGFAEYINAETSLVRICFILLTIKFPILILFYVLCSFLIPSNNRI